MRARQDAPIQYYAADQLSTLRRKVRKARKISERTRRSAAAPAARPHQETALCGRILRQPRSGQERAQASERFIESLRALQDKLGILNDLAVHKTLSLQIARSARSPSSSRASNDRGELLVPDMIAHRLGVDVERLLEETVEAFSESRAAKRFWKSWPSKPQAARGDVAEGSTDTPDRGADSLRDAA